MIIKIYTSKCEIEEIKLILRHFKFNTIKLKQPQKIWTNTKNLQLVECMWSWKVIQTAPKNNGTNWKQ